MPSFKILCIFAYYLTKFLLMKIKIPIFLILITWLLLVISCKKDKIITNHDSANLAGSLKTFPVSLKEAKQIYEQNVTLQEFSGSNSFYYGKPAWFLSYPTYNLFGGELLIVPLVDSFSYHSNNNLVNARLVFFKDSIGVVNSLMSVSVADSAYFHSKNGQIKTTDFVGSFQIYTLNGVFKEGFIVDQGQYSGYFTEIIQNSSTLDDRANCDDTYDALALCGPVSFDPCTDGPTVQILPNYYAQITITSPAPCPPDSGGGGGGGGTGGGNSSGGGNGSGGGGGGSGIPNPSNPSIILPIKSIWDVFNGTVPVALCWNGCIPQGMTHAQLVQLLNIINQLSTFGIELPQSEIQWMIDNPGIIEMINTRINLSYTEGQDEGIFTYIDQVIQLSTLLDINAAGFNYLLNDNTFYDYVITFLSTHDDETGQAVIRNIIEYTAAGNDLALTPWTVIQNWSAADDATLAQIIFNYRYIRTTQPFLNPAIALAQAMYQAMNDEIHTALEICGLVEALGAPCDLANGALFIVEGQTADGIISLAAVIPVIGTNITMLKYVKLANGVIHKVNWNWVGGVCNFGSLSHLRATMRTALQTPAGWQAHHVIPLQFMNDPMVQDAAKYGLDPFHINQIDNGISLPLTAGQGLPTHTGHYAYAQKIQVNLLKIKDEIPLGLNEEQKVEWIAKNVRGLMNTVGTAISNSQEELLQNVVWDFMIIP
jgi:uncharacterized membrane protein YgcG